MKQKKATVKKSNTKYLLPIIVVAIILAIFAINNPFDNPERPALQADEGTDIGDKAPDFTLLEVNGNAISLSDFRGEKAVVLNLWATWCPPCREEFPAFEELQQQHNNAIEVVAVNLQESNRAVENFLEEFPSSFTVLMDPDSVATSIYRTIQTQPITYFIDKQGIIVDKKLGPLTPSEIESKIDALLATPTVTSDGSTPSKLSGDSPVNVLPDGTKYIVNPRDILSGGPPKDGIPSIDDPVFTDVTGADWLNDDDLIMGLNINGEQKAYPLRILNWHEIVNDEVGGEPVLVTYCPLCRTGIAFNPTIDGEVVEFGTSGKLFNSELVMYDRKTDSYWSQSPGLAIVGELTGMVLEKIPMDIATFGGWKETYPDTQVLSRTTGFIRDYNRNPYSGYEDSRSLFFPVEAEDDRLHPKAIVFGVELNGESKAYDEESVLAEHVISDVVGGTSIVVVRDPNLNVVKIFETGGETFSYNNGIVDSEGNEWSIEDLESELSRVDTFGHFWFSWVSFNPDTGLYGS